jgi:hypothetical protein
MAEGWTSEWEKLFAKCATDVDYRMRLSSALAANDDTEVRSLLQNIGVGGATEAQKSARVNALKAFRAPFAEVSAQFNEGQADLVVAP